VRLVLGMLAEMNLPPIESLGAQGARDFVDAFDKVDPRAGRPSTRPNWAARPDPCWWRAGAPVETSRPSPASWRATAAARKSPASSWYPRSPTARSTACPTTTMRRAIS
jgi:hypothetical protein